MADVLAAADLRRLTFTSLPRSNSSIFLLRRHPEEAENRVAKSHVLSPLAIPVDSLPEWVPVTDRRGRWPVPVAWLPRLGVHCDSKICGVQNLHDLILLSCPVFAPRHSPKSKDVEER